MFRGILKGRSLALLVPAVLFNLTACYMEVHGDGNKDDQAKTHITHPDGIPSGLDGKADSCQANEQTGNQSNLSCYKAEDYTWRTSCKSSTCQAVKVFVHYMLTDDIGGTRVVHVEAFDNEHFQGAPVSTVRLADFDAKRGEWKDADLYLQPGEYYVRAYLTTNDDLVVPYTLGDMALVGDQPVGVFGALSNAEMVRVAPKEQNHYPDPVHIYLDKLFQKPGSEPDTKAHLRIDLSVADTAAITDGRLVKVELRKTADMADAPAFSFDVASELLLIQGRLGKTEFTSPSLKEGDYVVFVYLDANGNSQFDSDELSALHLVNTQPAAVAIRKNRTETISMALTAADPAQTH